MVVYIKFPNILVGDKLFVQRNVCLNALDQKFMVPVPLIPVCKQHLELLVSRVFGENFLNGHCFTSNC